MENVAELLENTKIIEHVIELEKGKQPSFEAIYSLGLVELETSKTYIKTNLANSFIRLFKSPARVLIFFDRKPDGSLRLYVDYQGLNNITIKNEYPLFFNKESLNQFDWAKQFIQLDLINAYHWMKIQECNKLKIALRICYGHLEY